MSSLNLVPALMPPACQNDDSIPVRANKKKGLKSKKELREEVILRVRTQLGADWAALDPTGGI